MCGRRHKQTTTRERTSKHITPYTYTLCNHIYIYSLVRRVWGMCCREYMSEYMWKPPTTYTYTPCKPLTTYTPCNTCPHSWKKKIRVPKPLKIQLYKYTNNTDIFISLKHRHTKYTNNTRTQIYTINTDTCISFTHRYTRTLASLHSFPLYLALFLICNTVQHTATHCITLQHNAIYCNILQQTALYLNKHGIGSNSRIGVEAGRELEGCALTYIYIHKYVIYIHI